MYPTKDYLLIAPCVALLYVQNIIELWAASFEQNTRAHGSQLKAQSYYTVQECDARNGAQ